MKHPIPPADEQQKVRERLRAVFKPDDPKLTPTAAVDLAVKLRAVVKDEKPGTPTHYVLLVEALRLAAQGGDLAGVIDCARVIHGTYEVPDLADLLAGAIARALGAAEGTGFKGVAAVELTAPARPDTLIALGKDWLAVRKHCPADAHHLVARRARLLLLEGLASPAVKGLDRAEAELALQTAEEEIEAADAKAGQFTLYAGKWVVKYENKFVAEYVITDAGDLTCERKVGPGGDVFLEKDQQSAKLVRRDGAVVVSFAEDKVLEWFVVRGDKLVVERFAPPTNFPKNPENKGEGTRTRGK